MKISKSLVILLCLLLVGCAGHQLPGGETVVVKRVISGQTLEVIAENSLTKVRLIGIQAPDLRQRPWGVAAKKQLEKLVGQRKVILELGEPPEDNFGRKLAYVWQGKQLVNRELVATGRVLADLDFPHKYSKLLIRAQEYARVMGYGIWNPDQPMRLTPREFRAATDSQL